MFFPEGRAIVEADLSFPEANLDDLEKSKEVLAGKPRDLCLFVLGIEAGSGLFSAIRKRFHQGVN